MVSTSSPTPVEPLPTANEEQKPQEQGVTDEVAPEEPAAQEDAVKLLKEKVAAESRVKEMQDEYKQGRSLYLAGDHEAAANKLSTATQLGVAIYGDFAPELFNSYGKALVDLSRADANAQVVLPPAVQDEAPDSDDEEPELEKANGGDGGSARDGSDEPAAAAQDGEKTGSDDSAAPSADAAKAAALEEGKEEPTEEAPADETLREDETLGEGDNASMAWEILEMARAICDKQEQTTRWLLNKAEVHVALGDALIVNEDYAKAREEFAAALAIQTEHLELHNRLIAEALFNIGLTHRGENNFAGAAEWFQKAADVVSKQIDMLKSSLEKGTLSEAEQKTAAEDLEDAQKVLEQITGETRDAQESAEMQQLLKAAVAEELARRHAFAQGSSTADDKPADDITAMVRKRKQPTAEEPPSTNGTAAEQKDGATGSDNTAAEPADGDGVDEKKARIEEADNGSA